LNLILCHRYLPVLPQVHYFATGGSKAEP
jgi:hypothetical protein